MELAYLMIIVCAVVFFVFLLKSMALERKIMRVEDKALASNDEFAKGLLSFYAKEFRKELGWQRGTLQFLGIILFIAVAFSRGAFVDIAAWVVFLTYLWICSAKSFATQTQENDNRQVTSRFRMFLQEIRARWLWVLWILGMLWLADVLF